MNKKWEERKMVLNGKKMLSNMSEIQETMLEISECKLVGCPSQKVVDKFTDFNKYAKDYLNLIKLKD